MEKLILFKTLFGSHLYGTDTERSDKDYKAIFMHDTRDIILGRAKDTFHDNTNNSDTRNKPEDIDIEYIELRRFLRDCWSGQTYALDMLFAPESFWLEGSVTWGCIIENRHKLLSKNVEPYIGYCRRQAGKYGLKGSRLGELLRVIDHFAIQSPTAKIGEILSGFTYSEFIKLISIENPDRGKSGDFLEVLGKKYELTKMVKEVLPSLHNMHERYGERAKLAMDNKGIDWKAVSHAFRCCYQHIELSTTGEIKFPLAQADFLREIKNATLDYTTLQQDLYELMEKAVSSVQNSIFLPDEPDKEYWEEFILQTYLR